MTDGYDKKVGLLERIEKEMSIAIQHGLGFDDWVSMKKYLLRSIPSQMRSSFSTRDPKTKKQNMNEFEYNLVDRYQALTGKILRLPDVK